MATPKGGAIKKPVEVLFSIDADGTVSETRIHKSSGNLATDQAALIAVKKAAPYPKLPDDFKFLKGPLTLRMTLC